MKFQLEKGRYSIRKRKIKKKSNYNEEIQEWQNKKNKKTNASDRTSKLAVN